MNQTGGYQPAATSITTVVVPAQSSVVPYYMRQGVKVGGVMLGVPCAACLGLFGGFFLLSGTIMLATANYDRDFWSKFNRSHDPTQVVGGIFVTLGLVMVGGCVGLCCYAKDKYTDLHTNPGRVINPSPGYANVTPGQPAAYPGQPAVYPGQPAVYPGQPAVYPGQPAVYPGQPAVYPGQPAVYPGQPAAYPGQPAAYPGQPSPSLGKPSAYPGQPSPSLGQPAAYPGQPAVPYGQSAVPGQAGQMVVTYQYASPGQAIPQPPASTNYPIAPPTYPTDPTTYPTAPMAPVADYPVKGEQPPPYKP